MPAVIGNEACTRRRCGGATIEADPRRRCKFPSFAPRSARPKSQEVVGLPALGLADHAARGPSSSRPTSPRPSGQARRGRQLLHGGAAPGGRGPGPGAGQAVLVPTMTFAATAEIVRYQGAVPLLVDCDPLTLQHGPGRRRSGRSPTCRAGRHAAGSGACSVVGIIPVHVGGLMMDMDAVRGLCRRARPVAGRGRRPRLPGRLSQRPAAARGGAAARTPRPSPASPSMPTRPSPPAKAAWPSPTTTELAVADAADVAARPVARRLEALLRATAPGTIASWPPGYKYNLTDIAAAIGNSASFAGAEEMRREREAIAP